MNSIQNLPSLALDTSSKKPIFNKNGRMHYAQRRLLGQRAMSRRKAMGLSLSDLSSAANIHYTKFYIFEERLPLKVFLDIEASWEKVLMVPKGWLRDASIESSSIEHLVNNSIQHSRPCETVSDELMLIACWLSEVKPIKRTTDYSKLSVKQKRDACIFASRHGFEGEKNSSLSLIGMKYGVSKERASGIVNAMIERSRNIQVKTPILDGLYEDIKTLSKKSTDQLESQYRLVLGGSLSLQGLNRFTINIFGKKFIVDD